MKNLLGSILGGTGDRVGSTREGVRDGLSSRAESVLGRVEV